jgi:mRNA interferase MazF
MVMQKIARFQIWLVALNPTKGREINKTRPCVVISPNEILALSTVLVAPMTTKGFDFPCRVPICFKENQGLVLLDKIRTVDKARLIKPLGQVDTTTQVALCERLQEIFAY